MARLFLECTVRAALIVLGTAIVLYAMRVKVASVKHRVWTAVLLLMLALPFWIVWGPKAPVRILPARVENFAAEVFVQSPAPVAVKAQQTDSRNVTAAPARRIFSTTEEVLLGLYLFGALIFLARLAIGTAKARNLVRSSMCVANPPGGSLGAGDPIYKSLPPIGVRCSDSCAAPVTIGCFRPTIVLPAKWRDWSESRLGVVLAHEREHVRRRDPLVQWLALFNRAIFWFHPAAWWLERELSALAEECCDAAVLAQGHDPSDYAETLMHMARAVMDSGTRVNVTGAAMPGVRLPERVRKIVEGGPSGRVSRLHAAGVIMVCVVICAAFIAATLTRAQSVARALPKFDVVSVRPEPPSVTEWNTTLVYPGGRFVARGCTVRALIIIAYNVQDWQVSGGPAWAGLNGERFNIVATPPENSPVRSISPDNPKLPPPNEERLMLRALLADRFHLVVTETKPEARGYALLLKGRSAKLADAKDPKAFPFVGKGRQNNSDEPDFLVGQNAMMAKLAQRLSDLLGMPFVDETGLKGSFDFRLDYVADASDSSAKGPLLPAALNELGLEMKPETLPARHIVVNQIERPTAN